MRLVCPNCDAEYEVDDAAIPATGRDVQCSSCGHGWFQTHPEVEAEQEAEAALYEPPGAVEAAVAAAAPVQDPDQGFAAMPGAEEPKPAAGLDDDLEDETDSAPMAEPAPAPVAKRSLDETVLAVLREEAEREQAVRQGERAPQPVIETQTELPLAAEAGVAGGMAAAVRRIARLRGVAAEAEPVAAPVPKSRREMLPAIEEINSTLRASSDRSADEDDVPSNMIAEESEKARSGSFRRGFLMLVLLAVIVVALYVLAPVVAARVPALAGVAAAYVQAVDGARVWLDVELRGLVDTLRGLAGGQGG